MCIRDRFTGLLLLMGNVTFVIYDVAVARIIGLYCACLLYTSGPFLGRLGPGVDDIPSRLHAGKAPTHHRGNDLSLPQNKHRRAVRGEHLIPRCV